MFFTSINPSFSLLLCVFIDYVSFTSHCEPTRGLDLPCTLTYIGVETAMLACKQSDLRQCGWFVNSPEFLIFCLFITPQSSHTDTRTVYITKYKRSQKNSTELFCSVLFCSVLFFSRPRSEGWPHHGCTFSIYPCPLSFWLTLPRGVLSKSWCCPSRPCVVFLACVHLALFPALSQST